MIIKENWIFLDVLVSFHFMVMNITKTEIKTILLVNFVSNKVRLLGIFK